MKRVVTWCLLIAMIGCIIPTFGYAAATEDKIVAVFGDGSYITEEIAVTQPRASGSKAGTKSHTYYSEDGTAKWKATLTGTFSYTGTSATCTGASCNVTIYDSAWHTISKTATKSGNTANASVTIGKKLLGVTVAQIPTSISITCDNNGNLS